MKTLKQFGRILASALFALALWPSPASALIYDDYNYHMQITFEGYATNAALTNFPVAVKFNPSLHNFDYTKFKAGAADLRFAASDKTTELWYEIEKWDPAGESVMWVRIPALQSSNDYIWAYWGRAADVQPVWATNGCGAVWTNDYVAVWHMTLDGTNLLDASTNAINAIATCSTNGPGGRDPAFVGVPTNVAGVLGGAVRFDSARSNWVDCAPGPDVSMGFSGDHSYSLEAWVNREQLHANWGDNDAVFTYGDSGADMVIGLQYNRNSTYYTEHFDNSVNYLVGPVIGQWTHLLVSYNRDEDTCRLYVDGQFRASGTVRDLRTPIDASMAIGSMNYAWWSWQPGSELDSGGQHCGTQSIDEVRVSSVPRSANWAWAAWYNAASNSDFAFYDTYGKPFIRNMAPIGVAGTSATIRAQLVSTGGVPTTVTVYWGDNDGGEGAWDYSAALGTKTRGVITQFAAPFQGNTTNFYKFKVENSWGVYWAPTTNFVTEPITYGASNKLKIVFGAYTNEALTDFPAVIALNESLTGFAYSGFIDSVGTDLRFADALETKELKFEIERWDTNGTSFAWVLVPELTSGTYIWASWGDPSRTTLPGYSTDGSVWANGFQGVWHMTNAASVRDSTAAGRHATEVNGVATTNAGLVANALGFDGIDDEAGWSAAASSWGQQITLEALVKNRSFSSGANMRYVSINGDTLYLHAPAFGNGVVHLWYGTNVVTTGSRIISPQNWHYVVGVVSNGGGTRQMALYVDGQYMGSSTPPSDLPNVTGVKMSLSNAAMYGYIDEVRVSSVARSSNWIQACYLNYMSNSLFSGLGEIADTTELPFVEPFEERTNGILDGQNKWTGSPVTNVLVQTNVVYAGTNAGSMINGVMKRKFVAAGVSGIYLDFFGRFPRRILPADPTNFSSKSSVVFFINTNGYVVARNNNSWEILTTRAITENAWERFTVTLDYGTKRWGIYVTNQNDTSTPLATNLLFASGGLNNTALKQFKVGSPESLEIGYIDNITIDTLDVDPPEMIDSDGDGLPDIWEYTYFNNLSKDGNDDPDRDGWNNMGEYISGTDPTADDSYLNIGVVDLVDETSQSIKVRVTAGAHTIKKTPKGTDLNVVRKFRIMAGNTARGPKTEIGSMTDAFTGTNDFVDANIINVTSTRFYNVAVTMGSRSYTNNSDHWVAFTQSRKTNQQYMVCVPVTMATPTENNLNSTLGRHLGRGLNAYPYTADTNAIARDADSIRIWTPDKVYKYCYWLVNGTNKFWWNPDTGIANAGPADIPMSPGQAFWIVRKSGQQSRNNMVVVGRALTNAVSVQFRTNAVARHDGWNMFGWPLYDKKTLVANGASTPTNQLGMEAFATGGTIASMTNAKSGDQIWVWTGTAWKYYWLMNDNTGVSNAWNGRWWDSSKNTYATFSLEPGTAYFYWHTTNSFWANTNGGRGAPTNFTWRPSL